MQNRNSEHGLIPSYVFLKKEGKYCICIFAYIYIHAYIHTDRQRKYHQDPTNLLVGVGTGWLKNKGGRELLLGTSVYLWNSNKL